MVQWHKSVYFTNIATWTSTYLCNVPEIWKNLFVRQVTAAYSYSFVSSQQSESNLTRYTWQHFIASLGERFLTSQQSHWFVFYNTLLHFRLVRSLTFWLFCWFDAFHKLIFPKMKFASLLLRGDMTILLHYRNCKTRLILVFIWEQLPHYCWSS